MSSWSFARPGTFFDGRSPYDRSSQNQIPGNCRASHPRPANYPAMNSINPILIDRILFMICLAGPVLMVLLIRRPVVSILLGAAVMWGTLVLSVWHDTGRDHEDDKLVADIALGWGWLGGLIYSTMLFGIRWVSLRAVRLVRGPPPGRGESSAQVEPAGSEE